ncbi:MAG: hypothetical protein HC810_07885, partial [Acaryochloridaceae cyanobacterium RL_2_7]|nr:hypothetical protein [Acaryochloridaceae cyanobacterium RL_2_7]
MTADFSLSSTPSADHPVKRFILSNIQGAIAISITGAVVLLGASTWNIWQLSRGFQT